MSENPTGKRKGFATNAERKDLTPRADRAGVVQVNLGELGFRHHVSETARKKIERNDVRGNLVVTTAARFAFR